MTRLRNTTKNSYWGKSVLVPCMYIYKTKWNGNHSNGSVLVSAVGRDMRTGQFTCCIATRDSQKGKKKRTRDALPSSLSSLKLLHRTTAIITFLRRCFCAVHVVRIDVFISWLRSLQLTARNDNFPRQSFFNSFMKQRIILQLIITLY
jgi:hypothetical protein